MSRRESPLLPVSDSREAALFFVISALCFLAALAALTGLGTYKAAIAWSAQIDGDLTLVLRQSDDIMARNVAEQVRQLPAITQVDILSREQVEALLEPSLGRGGLPEGLPVPVILALQADMTANDPVPAIQNILDRLGADAEIADNADYADTVGRALALLRQVCLAIVFLLSVTAIAVIASATNAALLARREIVDVLHLSGAADHYISRLFARRFLFLAFKAGLAGSIAALMVTALLVFSGGTAQGVEAQLLPRLTLGAWDLAILLACPILAGLAAHIAAHMTVMSALKEMV